MAIQEISKNTEQMDFSLPTMYNLPSEYPNESGAPDIFHLWQADLLSKTFCTPDYKYDRMMIASRLYLYYDLEHPLRYLQPDWFAVLGVPLLYDEWDIRLSYVVWQEKVIPQIAIEILSPGTEKEDLGQTGTNPGEPPGKWEVYEQILGIPWYAVFSRYTDTLRVFQLAQLPNGRRRYCEIALSKGKIWLHDLKIGLGMWYGQYCGIERYWLRWYDKDGNWISTPEEKLEQEKQRADQEKQKAEQEKQRADQEKQRADRLAAKLKELGISAEEF